MSNDLWFSRLVAMITMCTRTCSMNHHAQAFIWNQAFISYTLAADQAFIRAEAFIWARRLYGQIRYILHVIFIKVLHVPPVLCTTKQLCLVYNDIHMPLPRARITTSSVESCAVTIRAAERIIGPWRNFNFGPLAYLSLYM